jgi:hypothetical protein
MLICLKLMLLSHHQNSCQYMSFLQCSSCDVLMRADHLSWTRLSKSNARKCRNISWLARSTIPFSSLEYAAVKDCSIPHRRISSVTNSLWEAGPWSVYIWMTTGDRNRPTWLMEIDHGSCCRLCDEQFQPSGESIDDYKDILINICMVRYDPDEGLQMDYMKRKWTDWPWSGVVYHSSLDTLGTVEWISISCDQWYLSLPVVDMPH